MALTQNQVKRMNSFQQERCTEDQLNVMECAVNTENDEFYCWRFSLEEQIY
ncbi:hypothetical protein [Paenibacillus qinlingensis]|uniref:hypothetical protein n=1 Tax=Paenibacillus qinlingensis TaxID=1837343 RepID=UPI001567181F|nr:hypothetical protein [Paenibacillus qinlingensis]